MQDHSSIELVRVVDAQLPVVKEHERVIAPPTPSPVGVDYGAALHLIYGLIHESLSRNILDDTNRYLSLPLKDTKHD